jgi:hypothetical protein
MNKFYIENTPKKIELAHNNHKKHLMWINHKILRKIIFLLPFVTYFITFTIVYLSIDPDDDFPRWLSALLASMAPLVIVAPFSIMYFKYMQMFTWDWTFYKNNDSLELTDDKILNTFNYVGLRQIEIKVNEINKIVYNEYYKRINIYCNYKLLELNEYLFKNNNRKKVKSSKEFKNDCVRIYSYFDKIEEIVKDLENISGCFIKRINCPEKNPSISENTFYHTKL